MCEKIDLKNITVQYGNHRALDSLTTTLPLSKVTALVGGNGSGKSTLLEVLAGIRSPNAGEIRGMPDNVAIVLQHSQVPEQLPISAYRTVAMGRWRHRGAVGRLTATDRDIIAHSLERLAIADLAHRRLGELSGGQRQRVFIAQGLAQQASLLLLDEPLAAVDSVASELINAVIKQEREKGTTVVVATHHASQSATADCVLSLDRGQLVARRLSTPKQQ